MGYYFIVNTTEIVGGFINGNELDIFMTKENDKGQRIYRKLLFFSHEKIPVHFKLETGEFRNGIIIDLSEEKLTLVLNEFVMGNLPFLLEDIKEDSIFQFKEVGE